jgi:hypothetical protein
VRIGCVAEMVAMSGSDTFSLSCSTLSSRPLKTSTPVPQCYRQGAQWTSRPAASQLRLALNLSRRGWSPSRTGRCDAKAQEDAIRM